MKTLLRFAYARRILGGGLFAAILVAGCGDDPVAVDPVTTVQKTASTDNQQVPAGTVVPFSPEVTLFLASGEKAVGETVTFTVQGGGGTVDGGVVATDTRGTARVREWTLGQIATSNSLKATANGVEVTFTAIGIPGPAASVLGVIGEEQTAQVSTEVAIPPGVQVVDQFGNGVGGEPVQWQVVGGGGQVIGSGSMFSESDGMAQVQGWRLGSTPGPNMIEAPVPGFPAVQFSATAIP
jgi:hypothetical protein